MCDLRRLKLLNSHPSLVGNQGIRRGAYIMLISVVPMSPGAAARFGTSSPLGHDDLRPQWERHNDIIHAICNNDDIIYDRCTVATTTRKRMEWRANDQTNCTITWSTRRMVSAASIASSSAIVLVLKLSKMPSLLASTTPLPCMRTGTLRANDDDRSAIVFSVPVHSICLASTGKQCVFKGSLGEFNFLKANP